MPLVVLVGGVRAGKSRIAERLAAGTGGPVTVVATAQARDEEMARRIAEHRRRRAEEWTTVEEPAELEGALRAAPAEAAVVVDCLTLWVSNEIEAGRDDETIAARASGAADAAAAREALVVAVSNEVGSGVVPANALARRYADVLGRVNAIWAARADRCALVVAGRVLELSSPEELVDG